MKNCISNSIPAILRRCGSVPAWLVAGAITCAGTAHGQVVINEFMSSNGETIADEDGDFPDWIELYNNSGEAVNLDGWGLSDDEGNPFRWEFPEVTIGAGDFLLVWASNKDRRDPGEPLHTNFAISRDGEELLLSQPDGELMDFVDPVEVPRDQSYGRVPDGGDNWYYFDMPTPGGPNDTEPLADILEPPTVSMPAGFYTEAFELELEAEEGAEIRYTLDGSTPEEDSPLYTGPLTIDSREGDPNVLSAVRTVGDAQPWQDLEEEIFKITVLRARAFKSGHLPSETVTNSYLVGEDIHDRYQMPVVSLVTDYDNLFDHYIGIYVPGVHYDPEEEFPNLTGNFLQRGREWERPGSFELFEEGGARSLVQDVGIRVHGNFSRALPRKTFRLYARPSYGEEFFNYQFFPDSHVEQYKRILLRAGGAPDWAYLLYRDSLSWALLRDTTDLDFQYSRPAVVFVSGEYWGIHHFRDRIDRYFLGHKHDLDPYNLDLLDGKWPAPEVKEGDLEHYSQMLEAVLQEDLSDPEAYKAVHDYMDVTNFIDYTITHTVLGNLDWPIDNINLWRYRRDPAAGVPDHLTPYDGRWRWIVYDLDFTLGLGDYRPWDYPDLEPAADTRYNHHYSLKLDALLESDEFRNEFLVRLAEHLNTTFSADSVVAAIDLLHNEIAHGMEEHTQRWFWPTTVTFWENEAERVRDYARNRPDAFRDHAVDFFSLDGTANLSIDINDPEGGSVEAGHISIAGAEAPWEGTYFRGIPLPLRAEAAPGYTFTGWDGIETKSSAEAEIVPQGDLSLVANFEKNAPAVLLHYWNFENTEDILAPAYSVSDASLTIDEGPDTEYRLDDRHDFRGQNAQFGDLPGLHLRVQDPIGAVMDLHLPTDGYENIVLKYDSRRSGNGAGTQVISYSTDGSSFEPFDIVTLENAPSAIYTYDFTEVPGVANNPDFTVRIEFVEGDGGDSGNNRFDHITLEGEPLPGTNAPPYVADALPRQRVSEGNVRQYDLNRIFSDPEGAPLSFGVDTTRPGVVDASLSGDQVIVTAEHRGETSVRVTAFDGENPPIYYMIHHLVYPEAHELAAGDFVFDAWSADEPEGSYPESMLFLQTDLTDPPVDARLDFAYFLLPHHYHEENEDTIGFPYNNTRRTRLTGLDGDGIAFINTGRERDLGGAVLALDTRGVTEAEVSFLAGTVLENSRVYAIRLQYRTDIDATFEDVLDDDELPIEYIRQDDGHTQFFEDIALPEELLGQEYVQLLWRYYHVGVTDGPRAKLRLDDVTVAGSTEMPEEPSDLWLIH